MPKIIEFEGTQHEFPDDFSDDEIGALLGQSQASPSVAPEAPLQAENPNPLEPILMDGREAIAGLQTGTTPEAQQSDRIFAARLAELGPDISRFTAQVGAAGELSIPPWVRENDVFLVPDPQDNSLTFWRRSKDGAMPVEREEFIQRVRENSYFTPRKTEFEGPEDTGLTRGESVRGAFAQGAMSSLGGALEGAGIVDRMIMPSGAREIAEGRMKLGAELQEAAGERFPTNPIYEGTILQKMAQGAGSSLPFAVTGTLGGFLGPATSAFLGSLQSGAEQYKRAKAMGVSEEKAKTAFGVGALGGATEAFGIGRTGARVVEGIGSEVAEEMGQEGIQGFFGLLAQANYDPKTVEDRMKIRQVAEAAENMLIGGLTAGVIKLPSALTQKIFDSAEKPEPAPPGSAKGKAQRSLESPVQIPTVPPEGLRTEAEQEGTVPTPAPPPTPPQAETPAPTVEETEGTKKQQPLQPPVGIAGPALVVPEGPERVGTIGQTHADVRKAAIEEDLDLTEADHLFKLTDGRNVSRAEAWQIAKSQGLIKPEVLASREKRATPEKPPELQSQDLISLTFTEPATQQGPLSDVLESVNVYLHGPTDITNELRPDVPSVNVTDRVTGNTFQLPQDVTPEEIVTELNKRKRTFKVPEVTLPESFRGITQPLPFSPKEDTTYARSISSSATLYGDVFQPEVAPEGQGQVPVPEGSAGVPTPPVTPPAAPTPAPSPSEDPLSIQNAAVDKKREARGLSPRMTQLKRSFGFLWNQAMQAVSADPAAGTKLIESLAKNNRTPSDAEQALLLHEMVVRENDYEDAIDAVNNAKDDASRERAQEQLEIAADRNQQAYDVFDSTGTSSGRSLNARKMMANRDFSLARMNAETRAIVNEGKPLSKEQLDANKKLSDELSEVRTKLAAIEAKNKILEEQRLVDILKAEEKTRAKEIRAAARQGKSVLDLLEEKKDAAMKRIIDRRGKLNVTIDPLNIAGLVDEAIIGSYYIAKGLKSFTEWSAQMLKDFGNRIEPYLPALFQQSQQYHDANAKLFTEEDLVAKAKADAAAGKNLDPKLIFDLARQKVNQGITELHNVMAAVTTDLQGAYPGITEREVRDEFTGYGKVRYPSKKEDLKKLRELKRMGQLQSAIEDVMKRQAPKRSGAQRDAPTQDVRDKMRELRELMKEHGIETTSPEQQLKSVNDARVTQLKNQIADLDKQIRTGQKPKRGPKVAESPEVERLKAERDAMRELIQEIEDAKNPKLSPEQRQLAKDKRAIIRRTEQLKEKIAKGDYTKTERRAPLMDKEKRDLQFQEQKIREKFYRGLLEAEMKKRTPIRKVWDNTMDVLGLLRATKLSVDLGALGRQGGLLARGNPVRGMNALRAGLNAMRSEERHYAQLRDIWDREHGALYKASKLYIPDPTETKVSRLEEEYMSTLVRKVPLLAGSERGHIALLARLRADSFDAIIDAWFDGKPTAKQARAVSAFVNVATGRGELGQFAAAVPALNVIFNATSYYASRVQLLGYLVRSAMPGSWTGLDPKVANAIRYELAKGVAGNVVWWSLMALAAKALWPEDELEFEINPTSSDFGKIRSGKIVIDPLMGLTQYATLFSRIFSGQMKTKGGTLDLRNPKYGGPTTESVIGTFAGQRLSPNASMFRDLLRQSDYDRRKMSPLVFAENALPISINETYELMRSAGIGPGSALTMAMLLGDGVRVEQDYPGPLHSMFGVKPEYVGKKK